MQKQSGQFYEKLSHSLVSIALILLLLYVAQQILIPLAFAGLLSIVLLKPTYFFEKIGLSKNWAALLSVLIAVLAFFSVFFFIYYQVLSFSSDVPQLTHNLTKALNELELWIKATFRISSSRIRNYIDSISSNTLKDSGAIIGTAFFTLSNTVFYIVLVPIYAFLLLIYRSLIIRFFVTSFTEKHTGKVYDIIVKVRDLIKNYMLGLITETLIVGILNTIGFMILGIKYAFLLALIAALLNVVPYLGILIAALLCMLVTFATDTPATVAGVGLVLTIVHLIDSNILLPRIVGSRVRLNALITIIGVITGNALWGIPGMFLAIPIIALIKVIFDEVEGWNPWGILLGSSEDEPRKKKIKFFFFRKQ